MTPYERLSHITSKHGLTDIFGSLASEYGWFLAITDGEKLSVRAAVTEQKDDVFRRASLFGELVYRLLLAVAEQTKTDLRYLVV